MDDEDGRCLLDVICDPQALNDFLHGSETHLDTDDLLDGSSDPSSTFFSNAGGHVSEVQPPAQISSSEPSGLPRVSVDLDFLEDDILGGSPGGAVGEDSGTNGVGSNHEPCDILQQSLAEANITEQSLQEAEAELDLSSFGLPGLTQVVQPLADPSLSGTGGNAAVGVGIGVGGAQIFSGPASGSSTGATNTTPDMLGSVLAHQGLQLQPQVMNKAISVQPFMPQVGLGNVTLQPISSIQTLPNGNQSGHLGIGQIQVVGQPTVMTINQSGQQILTKAMGGYQLHQPGQEAATAGAQAGLGGPVLSSGGGLLIQGGKPNISSAALNGPAVCVTSTNTNSSGVSTMTAQSGLVGFGAQAPAQGQGQIMQNVIIQRTPTPIQPKPPQGAMQPKLFKPQQQHPVPHTLQNDASKAVGVQPVPVSAPNVTFLTGKPGSNVVLSTQATSQSGQFPQALFKQQAPQTSGKPLSVQLLNQSGSIVIPSQTVLQGQNHQFLLPQLQAGGQILTQHPGGIITSLGPGGQIIANPLQTANQNINLSQVLASQGHPGAAHILSGPIQLQPGQIGHPTLFQMPVTLAQTQTQAHPVTGHAQTVIHPIQNSLAMLSQVDGVSPAVSLQPTLQQQPPGGSTTMAGSGAGSTVAMAPCQPGPENMTVLGGSASADPAGGHHPPQSLGSQPSILTVQTAQIPSSIASSVPSSSPSTSVATSTSAPVTTVPLSAQHSPGKVLLTSQGSGMILSQESLMFLQQDQQRTADKEPHLPSLGVPASVIVSGNFAGVPSSGQDGSVAEPPLLPSQARGHRVSPSPGPMTTAGPPKVSTAGGHQPLKIQSASPSQPVLAASVVGSTLTESPQPSPLTVGQHIQSPVPQPPQTAPTTQTQAPARAGTPSSVQPLFIIHNQIAGSPQPSQPIPQMLQQQQPPQPQPPQQPVQTQIQVPLQAQTSRPPSQPPPNQPDIPPPSCSPKPSQAHPSQFHFAQPVANAPSPGLPATLLKQPPVPIPQLPGLTPEQQHNFQLISTQLHTLSTIAQPTHQQKQLKDKLQQVQQSIIIQAKQHHQQQQQQQQQQQTQAAQASVAGQFAKLTDPPSNAQVVTTSGISCAPLTAPPMGQPKSILVKPTTAAGSEPQVFPGTVGPNLNQVPHSLTQPVQTKQGVISAVGGIPVGKGALQIQVLNPPLSQLPAPQSTGPVQTQQASTLKLPFLLEPSKEAKMLEQLRKQQGSVLHPDYSTPFRSFEDSLQRLLPYHLYQGTASSQHDYHKVDSEFENVSCQLLKRTQSMIDKYRHLLFEESKRKGPSAEMVMIDRMFIQEEKSALNQDRILAKERPDEFVANSCLLSSVMVGGQRPMVVESAPARPTAAPPPMPPVPPTPVPQTPTPIPIYASATPMPTPVPAPTVPAAPTPPPIPYPPTKLVIKQGGGGASVSWSTSSGPAPAPAPRLAADTSTPPPSFSHTPPTSSRPSQKQHHHRPHHHDDDDAPLPQRTSKPPIKTYEARQRIGLKLKIKQEAGLSKVVHNTALDPVHSQPSPQLEPSTPEIQQRQQQQQPLQPPKVQDTVPPTTPKASVIRTPAPAPAPAPVPSKSASSSSSSSINSTATSLLGHDQRETPPSYPWSSSTSSSSSSSTSCSTAQMNGTLEHHKLPGVKSSPNPSPTPTPTPPSTSTPCRLPLRKTYRENVSPRIRPGVPGGGCEVVPNPPPATSTPAFPASSSSSLSPPPPTQQHTSPQPERTVIASVKLERQGALERGGSGGGDGVSEVGGGHGLGSHGHRSPPGLAEVEDVFCRGIKNAYHRHHRHRPPERPGNLDDSAAGERGGEGTTVVRSKRFGKNRERPSGTFRMDQHAPGPPLSPPSSDGSSFSRDSSLPAKRCKSDSPDMDNASFSSGSPPPDDSLNEHLQCAIDSILNLQQGPGGHGSARGGSGRPHGSHVLHHHPPHQTQGTGPSSSSSYRPSSSSSSSTVAQQVGGRGHNGSLVSQTHNR